MFPPTGSILDQITIVHIGRNVVVVRRAEIQAVGRTRIYITDEKDTAAVSKAHGRVFGEIKPANTLDVVAGLVGGYRVEIEAEAIKRSLN